MHNSLGVYEAIDLVRSIEERSADRTADRSDERTANHQSTVIPIIPYSSYSIIKCKGNERRE